MKLTTLLALGGAAYWLYTQAEDNPADGTVAPVGVNYVDSPDAVTFNPGIVPLDQSGAYMDPNLPPFMQMIRTSECGALTPDAQRYQTYYGGTLFTNMSDHPVITGEKAPVVLPPQWCANLGLSPGCVTTAAGAYQMTRSTWAGPVGSTGRGIRQDNGDGHGYLADFSPASQDIAAARLLQQVGALDLLASGNFSGAVKAASRLWASLQGSTAGQGTNGLDTLLSWFNAAGGALTA